MAKRKTVVEEVKLQDAPVLRSSPESEVDPETEPAADRTPWVDFIPPYVKDNAKGYPRYVDKLAEALNTVVENGGGDTVDGLLITLTDNVTYESTTNKFLHSWSGDKTAEDIIQARANEEKIYVRVIQNLTYRTSEEETGLRTEQSIKTSPNLVFDSSYVEDEVEYISYYTIVSYDGIIAEIPVEGGEDIDWITCATGYFDVSFGISDNTVSYGGRQVVVTREYPQTISGNGFTCHNYGNITTLRLLGMDSEDASELVFPNSSWYPDAMTMGIEAYNDNNVVTPILAMVNENGELAFSTTASGISGSLTWVNVSNDYYDPT